jgi:hypothetical protein
MTRSCPRSAPLFLLVATLVTTGSLAGCGTKAVGVDGTVPVTGTVTQKGAPLAGATVTFAPSGTARSASGVTDPQGKFALTTLKPGDGAMPGEYKVTVTKMEPVGKVYTQEEANEYYNKNQKAPPSPEMKNAVAEKFSKIDSSGLSASVKGSGKNEFTFDVE